MITTWISIVGNESMIKAYGNQRSGPIKLNNLMVLVSSTHKANVDAITANAGNTEYHPCHSNTQVESNTSEKM